MPPNPPYAFHERLADRSRQVNSLLCVGLDPSADQIPERFVEPSLSIADQLLNWNRSIIEASAGYALAFKPNIAFYEALGVDGQSLLRATLEAIPDDVPIILDAKRGDIGSTASAYASACFDQLGVDAVTLSPYLGRDSIEPFLAHEDKGFFVLCRTSNAGSADFQDLEISDWQSLDRESNQPLYIHVARTASKWSPRVGLVVGATFPDSLRAVRNEAPETWILVPGVGAQGGDIQATIDAGLREDGLGLVVNVSRGISLAADPSAAARSFHDQLNDARAARGQRTSLADTTGAALPSSKGYDRLAARLVEIGAVQFGDFTLASGIQSPIYIDLRLLVSDPLLLAEVAQQYTDVLRSLDADRIAGVPYAALPIGTAVSLASGVPMIYPRKEVKDYGLQRGIEGTWSKGESVVVIEDLITSGGSTIKTVRRLRDAGLEVDHAIVLIDREQGGAQNLAAEGVQVHGVMALTNMMDSLVRQGAISTVQAQAVVEFIRDSRTDA